MEVNNKPQKLDWGWRRAYPGIQFLNSSIMLSWIKLSKKCFMNTNFNDDVGVSTIETLHKWLPTISIEFLFYLKPLKKLSSSNYWLICIFFARHKRLLNLNMLNVIMGTGNKLKFIMMNTNNAKKYFVREKSIQTECLLRVREKTSRKII